MEILLIEQENKKEIQIHYCITCSWCGHEETQFPRPDCIKLYDNRDRCFQLCIGCLDEIHKKVFEEIGNGLV